MTDELAKAKAESEAALGGQFENDTSALDPDQMEAAKNEAYSPDAAEWDAIRDMSIYERIAAISDQLGYVQKGSTIEGQSRGGATFSYKGVSHDDVTRALQPWFVHYHIHAFPTVVDHEYDAANKLSIVTLDVEFRCLDLRTKLEKMPDGDNYIGPEVRYELVPDKSYTTRVIGYGQDYGDKGVGKAFSYGMKYALLKTFFLETGEDDEQRVTDIELATITANQYRELMYKVVDLSVDEAMFIKRLNQRVLKEEITDLIELPLRSYEAAMALLRQKEDEIEQAKAEGDERET